MDTITCNSCNRKVVPRLWHYRLWTDRLLANRFFNVEYMKTQHICPLCGVIMFETGGGMTLPAKIVFGFFGFMLAWLVLTSMAQSLFFPAKPTPAVSCTAPACMPAQVKRVEAAKPAGSTPGARTF